MGTLPHLNLESGTPPYRRWSLGNKIKMEWLNDFTFNTREEAKKAVFEYIELFYNRHRTHSTNGYVPPFSMNGAA